MWAPEGSSVHPYCAFYGEFSKRKIFKAKILLFLQEMPNSYHGCLTVRKSEHLKCGYYGCFSITKARMLLEKLTEDNFRGGLSGFGIQY